MRSIDQLPGPRRELPAQRRADGRRDDSPERRRRSCSGSAEVVPGGAGVVRGRRAGLAPDSNRDVLLTRRGNTLYVHLHRGPGRRRGEAQAADRGPRGGPRCLNTGRPLDARSTWCPATTSNKKATCGCAIFRRTVANTVLVVKLEFDRDIATATDGAAARRRSAAALS